LDIYYFAFGFKKTKLSRAHFWPFRPPSIFTRTRLTNLALTPLSAPVARADFSLPDEEVSVCDEIMSFARTYFEQKKDY